MYSGTRVCKSFNSLQFYTIIKNKTLESNTNVFPEAAEAHLPLRSDVEKENCNSLDTENHNHTQQLSHLNGSVKLTISEIIETEENSSKPEQQPPPPPPPPVLAVSPEDEEPHNLWIFPKRSGKFTQVR